MTQTSAEEQSDQATPAAGTTPSWHRTARRLFRNPVTAISAIVLLVIVVAALAAPLYAKYVSGSDPFTPNLGGTVNVDGIERPTLETADGSFAPVPIGPTWNSEYFFGADSLGRDVAARVLYGARTSLLIGAGSALLICLMGTLIGVAAGYFGGIVDSILSRLMDLIWAFPFYILAISLGTVLLTQNVQVAGVSIDPSNPLLTILLISYVFIPYVGRPVRALVASLRPREFVQAGILAGATSGYVLRREVMPNVLPLVITMFPLMVARTVLVEASLSFLGVGVQSPDTSWGLIINDGYQSLSSRPWISMAPGIMFTITLVVLTLLGEAFREELDTTGRTRGVQL